MGPTDTHDSTVLYVPDIHFVVAGDVVYGDVHQYLGEVNTTSKRLKWLEALKTVKSLSRQTAVASHKRTDAVDGVLNIETTRQYILAWDNAANKTSSPEELYERIQKLFPGRMNLHAILRGAAAAFS